MSDEMKQYAKEVHRQAHKPRQTRRIFVGNVFNTIGMDIVDMLIYLKFTGMRYILTMIDIQSRYAWAIAMKDKSAPTVIKAFTSVFGKKNDNNIQYIWCDEGKEFYNKEFKKWCNDNKVKMYSSHGGAYKNSIIERFNRTLRIRMERRLTELNTKDWVSNLDDVIEEYNNSFHRTLGTAPAKVLEGEPITMKVPTKKLSKPKKPKLKAHDIVRISREKGLFEKTGFQWSSELFVVSKVNDTVPITYNIIEWDGTPIEGSFYEEELQKTKIPNFIPSQEVKRRKRGRKTEVLIHYIGWPDKYDEWQPLSKTKKL